MGCCTWNPLFELGDGIDDPISAKSNATASASASPENVFSSAQPITPSHNHDAYGEVQDDDEPVDYKRGGRPARWQILTMKYMHN